MEDTFRAIKKRSLADVFSSPTPLGDVCGVWRGSITFSVRKEAMPVFVVFEKDGTYRIEVLNKRSRGTYHIEYDRIAITPITPRGIRTTTLFWTLLDEDTLRIHGRVLWIEGNLIAKKRK